MDRIGKQIDKVNWIEWNHEENEKLGNCNLFFLYDTRLVGKYYNWFYI